MRKGVRNFKESSIASNAYGIKGGAHSDKRHFKFTGNVAERDE